MIRSQSKRTRILHKRIANQVKTQQGLETMLHDQEWRDKPKDEQREDLRAYYHVRVAQWSEDGQWMLDNYPFEKEGELYKCSDTEALKILIDIVGDVARSKSRLERMDEWCRDEPKPIIAVDLLPAGDTIPSHAEAEGIAHTRG